MESDNRSPWIWVAIGLAVTLLCCLIAIVVAGGISFLAIRSGQAVPTYGVEIDPTQAVSTPVAPPEADSDVPEAAIESARTMAEAIVPIADALDLAERLGGVVDPPVILAETADPIALGTVQTFWASNVDNDENFQVDAELVYATEHVYFWVEQGVSVNQADVEDLVDEFEYEVYPLTREFFGSEWTPGVDGDEHLYVMFLRGLGNSIAGYFSSNDSLTPAVNEYSNGHEMFYLNADNQVPSSPFTHGVLAHEFQHMIHWYQDRNEETWMNEGFSELSALLSDFDVGGFDSVYASQPDQILTYWPTEPGTSGAHYGQAFMLLAYYMQQFGPEATQALVAHQENGLESIDAALQDLGEVDPDTGAPLTADDVFADWAVAMVLQDETIDDGRYAITVYDNPPTARIGDRFDSCPTRQERRSIFPYGIDYISIACEEPSRLIFDGASVTQVVAGDPHSGDFAFYSNRGDESDMTLTRSFDFTDVTGEIEMGYWVWYDIEEDWDYLYLVASDDGGETWQIVTTPSGTDSDPNGNSYGWGYTGASGLGAAPRWIEETVDLSQFAGSEVLLRFEYITDAAVNGEGLLLDDVTIEAIDYSTDFEDGDGGWEAAGFVRIANRLPQRYRLVLIEQGDGDRLTTIDLDSNQRAEVEIDFGGAVEEAILVVTNITRHTWLTAPYTVELVP